MADLDYFDIIKKAAVELNLDEPVAFVALSEPEYVKLVNNINTVNRQITLMEQERWTFRERSTSFNLVAGQTEYDRPDGDIKYMRLATSTRPLYPDYRPEWQVTEVTGTPYKYSIFADKILLYPTPTTADDGIAVNLKYYTYSCAKTSAGVDKDNMDSENDVPLIPKQYRDVLIYGACRDWKGLPDRSKYQHYKDKYMQLMKVMRANLKRSAEYDVYIDVGFNNRYYDDFEGDYFAPWR